MPEGLFIFDVWEKAEDWKRFADERLGAAIAAATGGQAPPMEPHFYPLHRQEHRQPAAPGTSLNWEVGHSRLSAVPGPHATGVSHQATGLRGLLGVAPLAALEA